MSSYINNLSSPEGNGIGKGWIIGGILVFALVVFSILAYTGFFKSDSTQSSDTVSKTDQISSKSSTSPTAPTFKPSSVQLPESPVLGSPTHFRGACLIGPSGTYLYVIETDGKNYRLAYKKLDQELIYEGFIPNADELKKGLMNFVNEMDKQGVKDPSYIQFLISSGAMKFDQIKNAAQSLKSRGYIVTTPTVEEEGRYALEATLSQEQRADSFIADVTPTVTRLSWYQEEGKTQTIELPGSRYAMNSEAQQAISDNEARSIIQQKIRERLPADKRVHGYIIWAAADELRGSSPRYSVLQDSYSTDKPVFQTGLKVLYTIQDETKIQLIWDWESAYPIGYVMRMKNPSGLKK